MKIFADEKGVTDGMHSIKKYILSFGLNNIGIIGIRRGGEYIARRVLKELESDKHKKIPFGFVDITFWRDDLTRLGYNPKVERTEIDFDVDGKDIILIDDVIFTGRTIRAAISEILEFGRPNLIRLAVLVDRIGYRELPIQPDFSVFKIETEKEQLVEVSLLEKGFDRDFIATMAKGERMRI